MSSLRDIFYMFINAVMDFDRLSYDDVKEYAISIGTIAKFESFPYGKTIGTLSKELDRICKKRAEATDDGYVPTDLSIIASVCYARVRRTIHARPYYKEECVAWVKFALETAAPYLEDEVKNYK